jgi:hypothetical protein
VRRSLTTEEGKKKKRAIKEGRKIVREVHEEECHSYEMISDPHCKVSVILIDLNLGSPT